MIQQRELLETEAYRKTPKDGRLWWEKYGLLLSSTENQMKTTDIIRCNTEDLIVCRQRPVFVHCFHLHDILITRLKHFSLKNDGKYWD